MEAATTSFRDQLQSLSLELQSALKQLASKEERAKAIGAHLAKVKVLAGGAEEVKDLPQGVTWFNLSRPLSLSHDLRGKLSVLDFWTFCCINCIHVLPELAELEHKYADRAVVFVGVHSAKFENEKENEAIKQAVMRYDIHHPVVNDADLVLWNAYDIHCWPTLMLVGPDLKPLALFTGEGNKAAVDEFIAVALDSFDKAEFSDHALPTLLEQNKSPATSPLLYPGKIAIDNEHGRLFISDSNNHRIVVTDLQGAFLEEIGTRGSLGFKDGSYAEAKFNRLQGVAYHKTDEHERLYVADAENHALRVVDLLAKTVTTLAGDGTQGNDFVGGKSGREQQLSTPWDVALSPDGQQLFVAMAGTHQIWEVSLDSSAVTNYSGDGQEMNRNNTNRLKASWAQPSGLSVGPTEIFIADAESSTIRAIHRTNGKTRTIVGGDIDPKNLFAYGDKEGKAREARLQHPLGVCWVAGGLNRVVTTDTYNHKVKLLDPATNVISFWLGNGKPGLSDGVGAEAQFYEPSGACVTADGKTVFVCDTNNHAIRVIDVDTAAVRTLDLTGFPAAATTSAPAASTTSTPQAQPLKRLVNRSRATITRQGPFVIPASGELKLRIKSAAIPPAGHHFTPGAPSQWQLVAPQGQPSALFSDFTATRGKFNTEAVDDVLVTLLIREDAAAEGETLEWEANVYYCSDDEGTCSAEALLIEIVLEKQQETASPATTPADEVDVQYTIQLAA